MKRSLLVVLAAIVLLVAFALNTNATKRVVVQYQDLQPQGNVRCKIVEGIEFCVQGAPSCGAKTTTTTTNTNTPKIVPPTPTVQSTIVPTVQPTVQPKDIRNCGVGNGVDGDTPGCPKGRNDGPGTAPGAPGAQGGNGNNDNKPNNDNPAPSNPSAPSNPPAHDNQPNGKGNKQH